MIGTSRGTCSPAPCYAIIAGAASATRLALERGSRGSEKKESIDHHNQSGPKTSLESHLRIKAEESRFFELFGTPVSGIGPKSALAILDIATIETLRTGGSRPAARKYLTRVSGHRQEDAEKIISSCATKIGAGVEGGTARSQRRRRGARAWNRSGYCQKEARDALRKVRPEFTSSNDRLREVAQLLARVKCLAEL